MKLLCKVIETYFIRNFFAKYIVKHLPNEYFNIKHFENVKNYFAKNEPKQRFISKP